MFITGKGRNQPLYKRHMTKSGRNRVKPGLIKQVGVCKRPSFSCAVNAFATHKTMFFVVLLSFVVSQSYNMKSNHNSIAAVLT